MSRALSNEYTSDLPGVTQLCLNTAHLDIGKRFRTKKIVGTVPNVSTNAPQTPEKKSTKRRMGKFFIIKHLNVQT